MRGEHPETGHPDPAAGAPSAVEAELTRLTRALRRARGHGNQHLGGISTPQYHLVEPLLDAPGPLPVGMLAEIAGTAAPTATTMARKLEALGLVERSADPADGRVVRLGLTPEGRVAAEDRRTIVRAWRRRIAAAVAPEDQEVGARVLAALADAVGASVDELAAMDRPAAPRG